MVRYGVLKSVLLAFASFCVYLILVVILLRAARPERRFRLMSRLHLAMDGMLVAAYLVTPPDLWIIPATLPRAGWLIDLVNALVIHTFLYMGWSMLYFLLDRGFSARIMIEIYTAPGGALSEAEVAGEYPPDAVVLRRLSEMVDIGRLARRGERFQATPRARLEGKMFAFLKSFFHLGPGG